MKRKWLLLGLLLLLLGVTAQPALAVTYRFQVTDSNVNVLINPDGTINIDYTITFLNDASADAIDFVDIGLPNDNYSLGDISAEINGQPVASIEKSEYVDHGVALALGSKAIPPGQQGTVHAFIPGVKRVLYPSTEKEAEEYASFQFSPNYFGSEYVFGKTNMTVTITLPPGLKDQEPRYYPPKNWPGDAAPFSQFDSEGRVFYRWTSREANSYSEYIFGSAFPARLVPAGAITRAPAISINTDDLCCFGTFLAIGGFLIFGIYSATIGARKRKLQYLPPKISIEGHGIKRGLTAIEAAILMEQPMDKILTMILFSVIKKGAAAVKSRDPLALEIITPTPTGLQTYETSFLEAFATTDAKKRRAALQDTLIDLIRSVTEKMRGFSRKESVEYYQDIMKKAWALVEEANTPDVKMQKFDEVMGWTMLDRNFDDHTRDVFQTGPVYAPTWWGRYDPSFGHTSTASSTPSSSSSGSGGTTVSLPTLPGSDFAVSMVGGIQSFSNHVVGEITNFTDKITQSTNPPPKPTTSSSSGRSGGGCACACACAGCACACAGGGR